MIIAVLDTFTSILAGCVIFSVLGTMAYSNNEEVEDIVTEGIEYKF